MSARTLQVITRQILAFPVDGGLVIAERFAAANIEVDEGSGQQQGLRIPYVDAERSLEYDHQSSKKVNYCCGCFALIWFPINLCMVIIGAATECSIDDPINAYVIVQGSFNLLQLVLFISSSCAGRTNHEKISRVLTCCNLILLLFLIAWTIAGSVWVWRSLDDWQDDHLVCNNAVFVSAIICVVLHYIVILSLCCCCACLICLLFTRDPEE